MKLSDHEGARSPRQRLWFEYHCLESEDSADVELWYRSHQQVTVIGMVDNSGFGIPNRDERIECGQLLFYRVRFDDGFVGVVGEDELLDSPDEFCRPNPPGR